MKYREDECVPETRDWRDAARDAAQDLARELGSTRRLTDADVRLMVPQYPWDNPVAPASGPVSVCK